MNKNELIPSARRLINSLRDLGYEFAPAVADLVDNSIEAKATVVAIDVEFEGDNSWVRIADNGHGMSPTRLKESLRYGADRDYGTEDLGKFGLGLKTASLSQCQRLTVASRTDPKRAMVTAFCWDLKHIGNTDRWEILPVGPGDAGPSVREPLKETVGTVVLWQILDRMLGQQFPYGQLARKRLSTMCRDLEIHLGMVFHRFLLGEVPGKKLTILVNGNEVVAWDPFARHEKKSNRRPTVELKFEHEGVTGEVRIEPFVLPHQQDFSSSESFRRASGPANWNQQQGFYIYRAGRLIQSGGWCRLRAADEHTKLARIGLSFNPALDDAFKVNVAKMKVQLPAELRSQIEKVIGPVIKLADETYRKRSGSPEDVAPPVSTGSAAKPVPLAAAPAAIVDRKVLATPHSGNTAANVSHPQPAPAEGRWTLAELQGEIESAAKPEELPVIRRVFARLRARKNGKG